MHTLDNWDQGIPKDLERQLTPKQRRWLSFHLAPTGKLTDREKPIKTKAKTAFDYGRAIQAHKSEAMRKATRTI